MINYNDYVNRLKQIQSLLLDFIDNSEDSEQSYKILQKLLTSLNVQSNKYDIRLILNTISAISNNHYRSPYFVSKLLSVIKIFQEKINEYFSNLEIFNIFKENKLVLLNLIENNIINIDESVSNAIQADDNYKLFFSPEVEKFTKQKIRNKYLTDDFDNRRKLGENDSYICNLIRNDSVIDFIKYITKNCIPLSGCINSSIFETNSFLIEKQKRQKITLIKYASFFGSIQIVRYLSMNNVQLDSSLFLYAAHSQNAELLHFLEEQIKMNDPDKNQLYLESIKCHHNAFVQYIQDAFCEIEYESPIINDEKWKYYNILCIDSNLNIYANIRSLIKYNYYNIVNYIIESDGIDINSIQIIEKNFYCILRIIFSHEIDNQSF